MAANRNRSDSYFGLFTQRKFKGVITLGNTTRGKGKL